MNLIEKKNLLIVFSTVFIILLLIGLHFYGLYEMGKEVKENLEYNQVVLASSLLLFTIIKENLTAEETETEIAKVCSFPREEEDPSEYMLCIVENFSPEEVMDDCVALQKELMYEESKGEFELASDVPDLSSTYPDPNFSLFYSDPCMTEFQVIVDGYNETKARNSS